ncbi:MAG: hypothetical protein R2695_21590 [Acidimicrobiales bacterium]
MGLPVAYELHAPSTPTLHARPESSIGGRHLATRNLWVTPYDRAEHRARATIPTSTPAGRGYLRGP